MNQSAFWGKSLRIESKSLGTVLIQPSETRREDEREPALIVYPFPMTEPERTAAVEWAAGTQTPIYCREPDIEFLEAQGFGRYRFHTVGGYREIGFQGGAAEFYPARRDVRPGWRRTLVEFAEYSGLLRPPTVNVLIRPRGEGPVLYLSSPAMDSIEWSVLMRAQAQCVVGSARSTRERWLELQQKWEQKWSGEILLEEDRQELKTVAKLPAQRSPSAAAEAEPAPIWDIVERKSLP
jgi:hypothetical protein